LRAEDFTDKNASKYKSWGVSQGCNFWVTEKDRKGRLKGVKEDRKESHQGWEKPMNKQLLW
jgi:hypothetical protein